LFHSFGNKIRKFIRRIQMARKMKYVWLGFVVAIAFYSNFNAVFAGPAWSIEGEYFEGCTCNPGCPCLFGSEPTHNKTCKIAGVFHIQKTE